jgi:hypothetical protein
MSGPKAKSAANGTKPSKGPTAQDNSTLVPSAPVLASIPSSSGKPDKAAYDAEQQRIKAEIDGVHEKLVRHVSRLCLPTFISNNA